MNPEFLQIKVQCTHEDLLRNIDCEMKDKYEAGYSFQCPKCNRKIFIRIEAGVET